MSKTDPDYNYLKYKLNNETKAVLIKKLKEKSKKLDFKILAQDIEPVLIEPSQKDCVLYLKEWLDTLI